MDKFTLLGAAAILSMTFATPVVGQAVSKGSGACPLSSQGPAVDADRGTSGARAPAPSARPLPAGCETTTIPWSAPVGHRQPQATDVQSSAVSYEQIFDREDATVDRMIRGICRGC